MLNSLARRAVTAAGLFLALATIPAAAADWKAVRFDRITVEVPATCSLVARGSRTADCAFAMPGVTRRVVIQTREEAFGPADTGWLRRQQQAARADFLQERIRRIRFVVPGPREIPAGTVRSEQLRPEPGATPAWADVCTLSLFEGRPRQTGADAIDQRYLGCGRFAPDFAGVFEIVVIIEDYGPGVPVAGGAGDIATTSARIFRSLALDR
jgi:hypothetical protein